MSVQLEGRMNNHTSWELIRVMCCKICSNTICKSMALASTLEDPWKMPHELSIFHYPSASFEPLLFFHIIESFTSAIHTHIQRWYRCFTKEWGGVVNYHGRHRGTYSKCLWRGNVIQLIIQTMKAAIDDEENYANPVVNWCINW